MKKLIFLVAIIVVSTYSFADIQSLNLTNPKQLQALKASWTSQKIIKLKPISDDMNIVYGGADISHKPRMNFHRTFTA